MVRMLAVTLSLVAALAIPAAAVAQQHPHHPQSHYPNPGGTVRTGLPPPQGAHYLSRPPIIREPSGPNVPPRH
jgi:hypothetical protein